MKQLLVRLAFAGLGVAGSAALAKNPLPVAGPAIVMFWAPWCAPCRLELRDYAALERAAAPLPLAVVALDTGRDQLPVLGGIPRDRLTVAGGSSVANLARWSPDTAGLPLTVAIDATGRTCARHAKRLDVAAVGALIERCGFGR